MSYYNQELVLELEKQKAQLLEALDLARSYVEVATEVYNPKASEDLDKIDAAIKAARGE